MRKIMQRAFTAKFKQEALKRIGNSHSATVVARELCVTPQTLRI
jgi:transposase-like protein